ncbi:MAG: hypothetical protein ACXQTW_00345 [Candidatus Methanospirareceae archaeon]
MEEKNWGEDDLVKALKVLAGTAAIPLKVAADITGGVVSSLGDYAPKPSKLASSLIDIRISMLKTITNAIEKEVELLEQYKEDLEAKEEEKKEKVKPE